MTIVRGEWHEITPEEPPGSYPHVTDGTGCWCAPIVMGSVIVHRPWAECGAETWEKMLASDLFPCDWNANRV
jgi:hypothetical protein